jgi:hypothetical protein
MRGWRVEGTARLFGDFGVRVDVSDSSGIMQEGGANPPMRALRWWAIQMGIANSGEGIS